MRRLFVDTFYLIALSNSRDQRHQGVVVFSQSLTDYRLYTVEEVLAEFLIVVFESLGALSHLVTHRVPASPGVAGSPGCPCATAGRARHGEGRGNMITDTTKKRRFRVGYWELNKHNFN
jgi:hypothetical protein